MSAAWLLKYFFCTLPGSAVSSLPIDHVSTDGWFDLSRMLSRSIRRAAAWTECILSRCVFSWKTGISDQIITPSRSASWWRYGSSG